MNGVFISHASIEFNANIWFEDGQRPETNDTGARHARTCSRCEAKRETSQTGGSYRAQHAGKREREKKAHRFAR